jgi:hypothetical protein
LPLQVAPVSLDVITFTDVDDDDDEEEDDDDDDDEDVALNVPPPEDVKVMVASVLFPCESVIMTVINVVPPVTSWLFPAVTVTLAAAPPEVPEPVFVPLLMLFCLLTSDGLQPNKIKRAAKANKFFQMEEDHL